MHLEVLVEEPSMEQGLRLLLPKLVGETSFKVLVHRGKPDLLQQLPGRLRGYRRFVESDWKILVVVDADRDDCKAIKAQLEAVAGLAGLPTRSRPRRGRFTVINRVVVEELEAWYFGDWEAVRVAFPRVPAEIPEQSRYRQPDRIKGGTWEAFERILQKAGYFNGGLRKVEAARRIAPYMDPARNNSPSFRALCDALRDIVPG